MKGDLIERLRNPANHGCGIGFSALLDEAADRIAALEASEGERKGLERVADLRVAIATALCGFVALGWDRREGPIRLLEQSLADDKRRALIPEAPVREA